DLIMTKGNKRKKRTWIVAGVVCAIVVALVVAAIVLLTKGNENAKKPENPEAAALSLEDILHGKVNPNPFNATWVSDKELLYTDFNGNLVLHNLETNSPKILIPANESFIGGEFTISADRNYLMIAHTFQKIYRYSHMARYTIVNLKTEERVKLGVGGNLDLLLVVWAPVGNALAFVYENNIYYKESVTSNTSVPITKDNGYIYNGIPDWVYEEEVFSSNKALWFSPDGTKLAFAKFDDRETPIMVLPIYGEPGSLIFQYPRAQVIKYPKVGTRNPLATLHYVDLSNVTAVKKLPAPSDLLSQNQRAILTTVAWATDDTVCAIWMNRVQNNASIVTYTTTESPTMEIISNLYQPDGWLELFTSPLFSKNGSHLVLILSQDQDNDLGSYRHIVMMSRQANSLKQALTKGTFVVTQILGWNHDRDEIFYLANTDLDPAVQHLYSVSVETKQTKCLSCGSKNNECLYNIAEFSTDSSHYVLNCAGPNVPTVAIHSLDRKIMDWDQNEELQKLTANKRIPKAHRMTFEVEGGFKAQVLLRLPPDLDTSGNTKYPMLVNVYAGPDSFQVVEKFNLDWGSYLAANKSIIYATIDGRGSGLKGDKMLFASYRHIGTVEIEDQINVTRRIQESLPYVDSSRTAIWGWSYGGYASGMILADDKEGTFKCGISVAPVTDWKLYDSIYTERFMGLPTIEDNYQGYNKANLLLKYEGLRDKQYFLIHGTYDDNVHYQQSMLWAKVLEQNDILFRQLAPDDFKTVLLPLSRFKPYYEGKLIDNPKIRLDRSKIASIGIQAYGGVYLPTKQSGVAKIRINSHITSKMPPVDKTPHVSTGAFELVNCLHAYHKVPVFEYRSRDTGLTVIVAEVEGPVVNGFFCLATEAFDDDGLPHTLEHLIFLGSEQYPYKGVLDLLANRCLASGTNAWTDTDHTCYTMETAGSEGFLALMPIFLEHILYPVLSEEGFITEVHHITPQGDDAGVVYCEMQGRENTAESRLHVNLARAMYPGHCGYSSETGGIMKNLRESTDNFKVREYHRQFYRPENLKVIITGQIKHDEIFKALESLEQKILAKGNCEQFQRPWQNPVPPLPESRDLVIKYPTDEESNGVFCIGWRGPSAVTEQYTLAAVCIFLKYLTEFSTYTLPKEFIEIEDPYASNISFNFLENSESCIYIMFEDVPLNKLPEVKPKLQDLLKTITEEEDINMDRIKSIIKRNKLEHLSNIENNPHNALAFIVIGYILYGNNKKDFEQRLDPLSDLSKLLKEPKSFWVALMKKYFVDNKYVAVQCIPSKDEHNRMAEEEADRVKKQIDLLGEDGLNVKGKLLEDAVKFNSRDPPSDMLTSLPIPSLKSINFHDITRYRTDLDQRQQIDLSKTSVYTCFDHIKSEFIYMYALLDSSSVPPELRIYLPLMLESLFESPIRKNGKLIPYEDVIEELNNDTVSFSASVGLGTKSRLFKCGPYSHTVSIMLQVEVAKYEKGVEWLRDILYNTVFAVDRLKIISAKMNNAVAQAKRSGRDIVAYAMRGLRFVENSNIYNNGILVQNKFLSEITETLSCERSVEVLETCERIWKVLTEPKNTVLHFIGNLDSIPNAVGPLNTFLPSGIDSHQQPLHVTSDLELLKPPKLEPLQGCIIGMGCLESSFFHQTVESICSYEDPDLPALMLYLQYLIQAEGPMWRQIRGKGYAYGYTMMVKPHEGLLYLVFSRATNVVGAYMEAKEIILNQIKNAEWDNNLIDSARSSLIFELIEKEKTIGSVIGLSVISYFQQVDFKHNRVGEKYLSTLFDPKRIKTAIVSVPAKAEQIMEAFKSVNIDLTVFPSLEESFLK
ncbi:C05D11.1-like, partial [Asbolus verrucosus]